MDETPPTTRDEILWHGTPVPQPSTTPDFTIEAMLGIALLALGAGRWEQGMSLWVAVVPALILAGWIAFRWRYMPKPRAEIHYALTSRHAVFEDRGDRKVFKAVPIDRTMRVSLAKSFGDHPSIIFGQPRLRSYRRRNVSRKEYLSNFLFVPDAPEAYRRLGEIGAEGKL